jgi:hypothetical protein
MTERATLSLSLCSVIMRYRMKGVRLCFMVSLTTATSFCTTSALTIMVATLGYYITSIIPSLRCMIIVRVKKSPLLKSVQFSTTKYAGCLNKTKILSFPDTGRGENFFVWTMDGC